ncbi:hypothetical protein [Streptomyces sp. NPDC001536]|uniref:hypothetical protein n=1 Tax=Streptomyces sp. NPDC001536 TaxID=3364583 RepID=UPI0036C73CF5
MTVASRPSARVSPGLARLEFMSRCSADFRAFVDSKAVPSPHGPALPADRQPFHPTRHDVLRAGEIEQMAWRPLLLHFGDMVDMHVLSLAGDLPFRQPGVAYEVHDLQHRGRVVGMWDENTDRPVFQLRASFVEPKVAHRIINAVQLLGGDGNRRPLHVPSGRGPWPRDESLYRPERCAAFRREDGGLFRVYTRPLTAAELALVLECAAPEVRKYLAVRRLRLEQDLARLRLEQTNASADRS